MRGPTAEPAGETSTPGGPDCRPRLRSGLVRPGLRSFYRVRADWPSERPVRRSAA
jgi:hypothetical protein